MPMHVDLHQAHYDAAYQGAPGAYSEEAAHRLLGPTASMLPRRSLEHVFEAVSAGGARHGVVPVENTLSGTVPNVYELLLSHDLRVVGRDARCTSITCSSGRRGMRSRGRAPRVLASGGARAVQRVLPRQPQHPGGAGVRHRRRGGDRDARRRRVHGGDRGAARGGHLQGGHSRPSISRTTRRTGRAFCCSRVLTTSPTRRPRNKTLVAFDLPHEPGALARGAADAGGARGQPDQDRKPPDRRKTI